MVKFKKGDKVKVTIGKDKGREGEVEKVYPKLSQLIVPGINMVKKHIKDPQGQRSGIYDIPKPLNFGKVVLICPKCKKQTRVGFVMIKDKKVRVCKKCTREIDGTKTIKK